ncbi:MAG: YdeI/OmpD-associated family protein [Solirubrobacteraceae bacterium]
MAESDSTPFATPEELRAWLEAHHASATELWVRLAKKDSGIASITWPELVDEVLCFGWIDGHMKPIDEQWRRQRITPRRKGSNWSKRNVERVRVLTEEGRMRPAGLAAFELRTDADYTYERDVPDALPPDWEARFRAETDAWAFFERQIPSYRRSCIAWVTGAKQEATRERRMQQLIDCSARGEAPPPYKWAKLKS